MFGQRQREPTNDAKPINRAQDDSSNRDPDFDNDNDRSRMFWDKPHSLRLSHILIK